LRPQWPRSSAQAAATPFAVPDEMSRTPASILNDQPTKMMLMTIAIILIILWVLGMVSATTMSGFIHLLLIVAVIMLLVRLIEGRRI